MKDKMSQIKSRLPEDLWKGARIAAIQENMTVTEWIGDAIKEKLAREPLEAVKERNRHTEEMAKIETDAGFKKGVMDAVGVIPDRLGDSITKGKVSVARSQKT